MGASRWPWRLALAASISFSTSSAVKPVSTRQRCLTLLGFHHDVHLRRHPEGTTPGVHIGGVGQ